MMNGSYSLHDLLQIPLKHRKKVIAVGCFVMFGAVLVLAFFPRTYLSEAKLFIRLGRESVTLDPTAQMGPNISLAESRETEINSVLEVLQSRTVAEKVVDIVGPDPILHPAKQDVPNRASSDDRSPSLASNVLRWTLGNDPALTPDERAVSRLQKTLAFELSKKRSNVLTLSCESGTPTAAQQILEAVVSVFCDEHVRVNQMEGSFDFFAEQTEQLKTKLEAAKQALRQAKNAGGLASVAGQRAGLESQLTHVRSLLSTSQAQLAGSQAKERGLADLLQAIPKRLIAGSESGHDNAAADDMRALLFELEIQEKELLSRFTNAHPKVRAIRQHVLATKQILAQQPAARTRVIENTNPAYQQLEMTLLQQQANSASLLAERQAAETEGETLLQKIRQLNQHEILIAEKQQDVAMLEESYRKAYAALEQSRISDALEQQRISNVSIVQSPTLQRRPASPRKLEIVLLAGFLAVFGGVGTAFVAEHWSQSEQVNGQEKCTQEHKPRRFENDADVEQADHQLAGASS